MLGAVGMVSAWRDVQGGVGTLLGQMDVCLPLNLLHAESFPSCWGGFPIGFLIISAATL